MLQYFDKIKTYKLYPLIMIDNSMTGDQNDHQLLRSAWKDFDSLRV